jgi:hypothetical protein
MTYFSNTRLNFTCAASQPTSQAAVPYISGRLVHISLSPHLEPNQGLQIYKTGLSKKSFYFVFFLCSETHNTQQQKQQGLFEIDF